MKSFLRGCAAGALMFVPALLAFIYKSGGWPVMPLMIVIALAALVCFIGACRIESRRQKKFLEQLEREAKE